MYLKSIEIHGFKSFANKIVFEFPEGITGIVGPNGSGKSNVADAVRWVLGEQKIKQLRGSKMEDVIFAGTSARKPQSYAFVAITLDNSDHKLKIDFNEVTVSRRVYRSGESEYMINGSVCRLRDVQELFYDTGIGKEGYSIIGQGQIDKILQGKPEERREIFDEAVGIVKYKKRKTMSLRKLENERLNLARVNDILSELKKQVGPLKRQSEAAEQFVVYKNELTRYDINLFLLENGDIRARIKDCREKEKIAEENLEQAKLEFESTKQEYEKLSELLAGFEEEISRVRNEIARSNIVKENLKGQILVIEEQIKAAQNAHSTFLERVDDLKRRISETDTEQVKLLAQKEENQKILTKTIAASGQKDSYVLDIQNEIQELNEGIEENKTRLMELLHERGRLNARMERLDALMEQMKARREELESNLERFSSDKELRDREVQKLEDQEQEIASETAETEASIEESSRKLQKFEESIRSLENKLAHTKEQMLRDQAALESLRNITERYEGYGNTIKAVMKLKESTPGIHGVVADIIRTEKKYELAIETALGGSIQNIVTDTENTAKNVIEYLKTNKLGRATFLPLKAITGRGDFRNEEVFSETGVIGLASSLVTVEDQYRGVADYLLGRIVVADTIDHALTVARKYRYSLIIVTLEGELLNRGGSMTGGAFKNKSNLLGRRREMEELEHAISTARRSLKDLQEQINTFAGSRKQEAALLEEKKASLQEQRILLNTVRVSLKAAREKTEEMEGMFRNVGEETKSIDEKTLDMKSENETVEEQMQENLQAESQIKQAITDAEAQLAQKKKLEAEQLLLAQTLKVEMSRLTEQNNYLGSSVNRAESMISQLQEELRLLEDGFTENGQEVQEKKQEIVRIQETIAAAEQEIAALSTQLSELEQQKETHAGTHKDFIARREEFAEKTANLDKEVFRLVSMREKLEERFETKSNYIWEEYQLTYNNALSLRDESLDNAREMREKISSLKSSIKGLGVINVGAIEEYKEVKERFDFLSGQHDDLVKAEADLVKIIRDLDREMRRQFNVEFKKICEEFARVFKEMFGGGYGTIELEEDADVLEAGITVIAQPPGKKLQNMMQLSGGEKALTAIALLFAIQNLKPSPFCILDEIEAALDDSNIFRFAGYLHKLTKDTQFIVITHRKGTMEAADRLYGITMQERGVSTLISVDLADIEDEQVS